MDNASALTPQQDEQSLKTPRWATILQDWKVLIWPAFVAFLAGFLYFMGFVVNNGKLTALGISALIERPPINQEYFIHGTGVLSLMALYAATILAFAGVVRAIFVKLFRFLPTKAQAWVKAITKRRTWGWIVVTIAVATWLLAGFISSALMKDADGLILKSAKELGTSWVRIGIEADQSSIYGYMFLTVGMLVLFVFLSWWILTRFAKSTVGRMIYGAWATINILWLVAEFAFLLGISTTFEPFPIVTFTNMDQNFGKGTLAAFLGSDDKQYASLVILKVGEGNETPNPGKVILVVPRSEVKWMIVLRKMPLHLISHYHDFKALLQTVPSNPAPSPNTSGAENPKP